MASIFQAKHVARSSPELGWSLGRRKKEAGRKGGGAARRAKRRRARWLGGAYSHFQSGAENLR